jgi:HK97 family phage major capsid protein
MNFKQQMEDAKARIKAAQTVEEVKAAQADYERAKAAYEAEKAKEGVLSGLAPAGEKGAQKGFKTLGEFAAKNLNLEGVKESHGTASTDYGFKAATDTHVTPPVNDVSQNVVDIVPRQLTVRDLLGAETISGNALTYYVMGATEGASGVVKEGAQKNQIHVPHDPVTVSLSKIAAFFKESDELLEDAPFLESTINNRGEYEHALAVEKFLLAQLLGTSGIQTTAFATSAADTIFTAMTGIQTATGYTADAIVLNPVDYQAMRLAKDGNGQYMGGGYFTGAYGNGAVSINPGIWGMNTVTSPNVEKGTALVGAFKAAGSVVTKAGSGLRVEVSNSNEDDFTHNLVTVRIEERMALAVRVPAAFSKVALAGA